MMISLYMLAFLILPLGSYRKRNMQKVCNSEECYEMSEYLRASMDFSKDPCIDFHAFLCGKRKSDETIKMEMEKINKRNKEEAQTGMKILANANQNSSKWIRAARKFYESCTSARSFDLKPYINYFHQVSHLPLDDLFASLTRKFGIGIFFDINYSTIRLNSIDITEKNGFIDAEWYQRRSIPQLKKHYQKHLRQSEGRIVRTLMLLDNANISLTAPQIIELESSLLFVRNVEELANLTYFMSFNITELMRYYGHDKFNWLHYFNRWNDVFDPYEVKFTITNPFYVRVVMNLLRNNSRRTEIVEYAFINIMHNVLSKFLENPIGFNVSNQLAICLSLTFERFNPLVVRTFQAQQKESTLNLFSKILDTTLLEFVRAVIDIGFDANELAMYIEKFDSIKFYGVYPKELTVDKYADKYFGDFVENLSDDWSHNVAVLLEDLGKRILTKDIHYLYPFWTPFQWNFNNVISMQFGSSVWENKIGLMESQKSWPNYIRYARMAHVLAHELGHMLDHNAWHFYANMSFRPLSDWSPKFSLRTQHQMKCFTKIYERYELMKGIYFNTKQTINENIADAVGLKLALRVFKALIKNFNHLPYLTQFGIDAMYFIFIGTSPMYCADTYSDEFNRIELAFSSKHTLGKYRLNGMVASSETFAKAFGCCLGKNICPFKMSHFNCPVP